MHSLALDGTTYDVVDQGDEPPADAPPVALVVAPGHTMHDDITRLRELAPAFGTWPCIVVSAAGFAYGGPAQHWLVNVSEGVFARHVGCLNGRRFKPTLTVWVKMPAAPVEYLGSYVENLRRARAVTVAPIRLIRMSGWPDSGVCAWAAAGSLAHRVVLAGMPLDEGPKIETPEGGLSRAHLFHESMREEFVRPGGLQPPALEARTRSLSGRTRDILGEPTAAWLRGED